MLLIEQGFVLYFEIIVSQSLPQGINPKHELDSKTHSTTKAPF